MPCIVCGLHGCWRWCLDASSSYYKRALYKTDLKFDVRVSFMCLSFVSRLRGRGSMMQEAHSVRSPPGRDEAIADCHRCGYVDAQLNATILKYKINTQIVRFCVRSLSLIDTRSAPPVGRPVM
jgi:hypothetical protein